MTTQSFMDERDWSALPGDVIHLIFRKLPDFLDFVRSRAVCKPWCSATSLSDLPMCLPWLLECKCGWYSGQTISADLCYYSVSSKRTGMIDIKDCTSMTSFRGPSHGYVLLHKSDELALLNPLTKETISLPYLDTSKGWPIWTGTDSNLIRDQDVSLVNAYGDSSLSFLDKENRKWISIDEYGYFISCCYFKEWLVCIDNLYQPIITIFDVLTREQVYSIMLPDEEAFSLDFMCLVESTGVLLGVFLIPGHRYVLENATFRIYELHFGEKDGEPHWVRITSIGDQVLFLNYTSGFSTSSARFPELRGNCIYFTSSNVFPQHGGRPYKYNIELGTIESLECPFDCCSWFVPCLG